MENNGSAKYTKVTKVTGTTVHFTSSRAYTGSNGAVYSVTKSTGAGLMISGALNAASNITIGGTTVLAQTFSDKGKFYEVAVEKVTAAADDYIYVFQR